MVVGGLVNIGGGGGKRGGREPNEIAKRGEVEVEQKLIDDGHQILGYQFRFKIPGLKGKGSTRICDIVSKKDGTYYLHEVKTGARHHYFKEQGGRPSQDETDS